MANNCKLVVKLNNQVIEDEERLKTGELFNIYYACCCAWVRYGCPITKGEITNLSKTTEWEGIDVPGYWTAVQNIGEPAGGWFERTYQLPKHVHWAVYNLYLPKKQGTVLAIGRLNISQTFPPRKNLEWCGCYILDPAKGVFHINTRGLSKFAITVKQAILNLAVEILAPQHKASGKDLCWADITNHIRFTIKDSNPSRI